MSGSRAAERPPAVLLGGKETALPVARSLGRQGIPVYAIGSAEDAVRLSRYCLGFDAVGDDPHAWLERLMSRKGEAVLIPLADQGVELTARECSELRDHGYILPPGRPDVALSMLDKDETQRIARRAAIPVAAWRTIRATDALPSCVDGLAPPCAVKPLRRHEFQELTGRNDKLIVAASKQALGHALDEFAALGVDVMVTEIIPGPDSALWSYQTYVDEQGVPLFDFTIRKLRQAPPHFGVGALVIGEWDPGVATLGRQFLEASGARGPVEVEFKRDVRTGELKFIECNHRLNFLIELARRSGFDLPLLTYRRAIRRPDPPLGPPRWGYRLWHPLMDFRAVRAYRKAGEITTRRALRPLLHREICFTVWDHRDPRPGLDAISRVAVARIGRSHRVVTNACRNAITPRMSRARNLQP